MQGFITFEGIEGSGKTTQIARASEHLRSREVPHLATREPGGTPIGDGIRGILLDPASVGMTPMTELLLISAARVQHLEEVILPALDAGKVVLCDRFEDSTRAYQGHGRQLPANAIRMLSSLTAAEIAPDLTFLLDLPADEGLARARGRNAATAAREGRIDEEKIAFHRRVRDGFLELAVESPGRFRVLDATEETDRIARRIAHDLSLYLKLT